MPRGEGTLVQLQAHMLMRGLARRLVQGLAQGLVQVPRPLLAVCL